MHIFHITTFLGVKLSDQTDVIFLPAETKATNIEPE